MMLNYMFSIELNSMSVNEIEQTPNILKKDREREESSPATSLSNNRKDNCSVPPFSSIASPSSSSTMGSTNDTKRSSTVDSAANPSSVALLSQLPSSSLNPPKSWVEVLPQGANTNHYHLSLTNN